MQACRITPLEAPYDAKITEIFNQIMPAGMAPLKLFRTQARNPRILERMFAANLLGKGAISLRERELIILRTCARCASEYEWGVHVALFSQRAGLAAETIRATLDGVKQGPALAAHDAWLFDAVDELHDNAAISDQTWAALSSVYSTEQLLEIIALVGFYHSISFMTNAARIELEVFAPRFSDYANTPLTGTIA